MLNERLNQLIEALPVVKQLFGHDVFLSVIDADRVVQGFAVPEGEPPRVKVGDVFHDTTGALDEVLRTGKTKRNFLPKEVLGEALEGILVPVRDGNNVVGCVTCTYSVEVKEHMGEITARFQESVDHVGKSIRGVVSGIEELSRMLTGMDELTNSVEMDVRNAVEVVNKISSNAARSNILALNASIEATHSGEHGRGFSVVATEMGKLAKDSGSSATAIKATLNTINKHMANIVASIRDANGKAQEHMESVGMIQKILEETLLLADGLEEDIKRR